MARLRALLAELGLERMAESFSEGHARDEAEDQRVDRPTALVAAARERRGQRPSERLARWIGKRHKARRALAYAFWRVRRER